MKLKTGSSRPKKARTADACMLSRMLCYLFAVRSTFSAVHAVLAYNYHF